MKFSQEDGRRIAQRINDNPFVFVRDWFRGLYCQSEIENAIGVEETSELLTGEKAKDAWKSMRNEVESEAEFNSAWAGYVESMSNPVRID